MAGLHHVDVWVADRGSIESWAWLLARLGFERSQTWAEGESWSADGGYLTLTTSLNLSAAEHDRLRPGMNHLAFLGGGSDAVDELMRAAPHHGWKPLYHDRYPHAGGPDHYAGWLENDEGFKVEVVADRPPSNL